MKTNLKTADKIILFIPKKIIEANDYSFVLKIFDDVLKDPALIRKFKNQVTIGFDGYDDEPKEVFEINEVRNYIQHLSLRLDRDCGLTCLIKTRVPFLVEKNESKNY